MVLIAAVSARVTLANRREKERGKKTEGVATLVLANSATSLN